MTKRDKPPAPIVRLERGRLSPISSWDAELMSDTPDGAEFDLVRRGKRSKPHNGMYWAQLGLIVKATDAYATSKHMHRWIKSELGYTEPVCNPNGKVVAVTVDSTAFEEMTQPEFNVFYKKAAALIAAEMGIDLADVVPGWSI